MITNLDQVLERLADIHDCEEEMCGCGIHLLMAEISEGMLHEAAQQSVQRIGGTCPPHVAKIGEKYCEDCGAELPSANR